MMKFESRKEVAHSVASEGLGYFILDYASAESMPDPELELAFREAEEALKRFDALLPSVEH